MGSVKLETRNEGRGLREWDYLSLGEERTVSNLIANRSRQDPSFYPSITNADINNTAGVSLFSEPILCTYIDLERLINTCGLSKMELAIIKYLMQGYAATDIADHFGYARQTVETLFKRAVKKICKRNEEVWYETYSS